MSVKEELAHYFDELLSYWNNTFGTLPKTPFDEEANPSLYQGEPDEDEYVSWKPIEKEMQEDFEAIEANIDLHLHSSIKEYFNSFWFLNLQGFYNSKLIILEPVQPGMDINNFFVNQKKYEEHQGKILKNIQLGYISPENMALMVNNETGEILQEDFETGHSTVIAKSLEELIKGLRVTR